jgi:hypothetical protein
LFILRSFLFSFAILWRFVLALPILALILVCYGLLALALGFVLGFVSPILAVLVGISVGLASSVIPVMVGTRVGLQAGGVRPRNSYASLILPSIGYGLFEGFCIMLILAISLGVITLATPMSFLELLRLSEMDGDVIFARLLAENAPVTLSVVAVASFWTVALRTAFLVPFAGASVGLDPSGQAHTPFFGFGSRFWSIMILVIISYVGTVLVVPVVGISAVYLGFGDTLTAAGDQIENAISRTDWGWLGAESFIVVGVWLVLVLWFFSLQCAGAALAFLRFKEAHDLERDADIKKHDELIEAPMIKTDMGALVRSRMPQHRL